MRYLAAIEARLGVRFPESYVEVFQKRRALTGFPWGELYAPADCAWDDSGDEPAHTLLAIGMYLRGDARPILLQRASATTAELSPELWIRRDRGLFRIADSLTAAFEPPPKVESLEEAATRLLREARRPRQK